MFDPAATRRTRTKRHADATGRRTCRNVEDGGRRQREDPGSADPAWAAASGTVDDADRRSRKRLGPAARGEIPDPAAAIDHCRCVGTSTARHTARQMSAGSTPASNAW